MVHFVTGMLVDPFVAIKHVTDSVAIKQLEVSAAHMQVGLIYKSYLFSTFVFFLLCI